MNLDENYLPFLHEHLNLFSRLDSLGDVAVRAAGWMAETINSGGKILVCGNGGSAADAQHFAAELVGRFEQDRRAWPAIALTTDTSILTAVANDYAFDGIFARQVEALGEERDLLLGISTSGNSQHVVLAVEKAKPKKMKTVGLLGRDGGKIAGIVDLAVIVPYSVTARIQEAHIFIIHVWCSILERKLISSALPRSLA